MDLLKSFIFEYTKKATLLFWELAKIISLNWLWSFQKDSGFLPLILNESLTRWIKQLIQTSETLTLAERMAQLNKKGLKWDLFPLFNFCSVILMKMIWFFIFQTLNGFHDFLLIKNCIRDNINYFIVYKNEFASICRKYIK